MKQIKTIVVTLMALTLMIVGSIVVNADTATDLSSLKVYAVDASNNQKEVKFDFNSTTYEYNLTVMSDTVEIKIEATPATTGSTYAVEKDGVNTKMDEGDNLTNVIVTSASGAKQTYTLKTKKLSAEEEATYQAPEGSDDNKNSGAKVKIGKKTFKISLSIDKKDIPEGFTESKEKYKDVEYPCINGEKKEITAFYLVSDDEEGFYIYDADNNNFYAMKNIKIKSRMFTIVKPDKIDSFLDSYAEKTITVIDQEAKVWVLDEEKGLYLLYAMNWNGDTTVYCYDDNEKSMQRYTVSTDANKQMEAASKAYEKLQKKYNKLVDKYNIFLKIVCGLVILVVILLFVIFNMKLNRKEKAIKDGEEPTDNKKEKKNKEGNKDFYGGEIEEEADILIDINDDEENAAQDSENEIQKNDSEQEEEASEIDLSDIMETEESMKEEIEEILSDEKTEEEDDDFEFIDLD